MFIVWKQFGGIAPLLDPRRLPAHGAQTAENTDLRSATIDALKGTTFIWTPTKAGTKLTIYRFGESGNDESLYWFTWTDDVDVVRCQISGDTTERTLFAGDSAYNHPRWTNATLALTGGGTDYPIASYRLGVPAPTSAPTNGGVGGTGSGTTETRAYVYCHVTVEGDVGQPSDPLEVSMEDGQSITLNGLVAGPAGYNINRKWIYRTLTGLSSGTNYQFVAEIADGTTTYVDSILNVDLDETMFSLEYEVPDVNLVGLVNLPNGMMAGFIDGGIDVCFCVPYKPYAWPSAFRQVVDYPIVGLGVFGETLVVCTRGQPYVMFGTDPNAISVKKLELAQACVSKRSIVNMGDAVLYASPDGIVRVGPGLTDLITGQIISKEFWTSLAPESIHAYCYDGKYIGFYDNGTTEGSFVFDPADPLAPFAMCTVTATAGYRDLVRDALYLAVSTEIKQWEDNATKLSYTWKSRISETPKPINFGWGKVEANAYPVTLKLYANGSLKHTQSVASKKAFRLPSGYIADAWEVQIEGSNEVTAVYLAQSDEEIKGT